MSGGKDSIFASLVALQWGWDVTAYVTLLPEADAPMLFHRPNAKWVELQANAAGVPWKSATIGAAEDETDALREALRGVRVDGVTSGALASEYQRTRFESVCQELGLKTFAPLWHHDRGRHLLDLRESGIDAMLVHVAAEGLDRTWLGKRLDEATVAALKGAARKSRLDVAGEGGEYETFVTDAPHFVKRIDVVRSHVDAHRDHATLVIEEARLLPKGHA